MRLIKLLLLVIASGVITFGTAHYLYTSTTVDPFPALLYQGIFGVACGAFGMMKICEDYDDELIKACLVWKKGLV